MDQVRVKTILAEANNSSTLLNFSDKILIERRKRYQTYIALDYYLSAITYFDYYSRDSIQRILEAKYIAQLAERHVRSEYLVIPFCFDESSSIFIFLEELGVTKKDIDIVLEGFFEKKKQLPQNLFERFLSLFGSSNEYKPIDYVNLDMPNEYLPGIIPSVKNTMTQDFRINFSFESQKLFEKAIKNALEYFRSPVVSPEILFFTLLEDKKTGSSKLIRKLLKNDETKLLILRYKLIRRIYSQEAKIKNEIKPNYHFFAYLLKIHIGDFEFDELVEDNQLEYGILNFRKVLLKSILNSNIYDDLEDEVILSIKNHKKRFYSR
jgi:hypothetical protein